MMELSISIHAPMWGATETREQRGQFGRSISIHAPMWGATILKMIENRESRISIHAPMWGATWPLKVGLLRLHFNPRTHVGCDSKKNTVLISSYISIHAPMWGATWISWVSAKTGINFNPRTHVGCDYISTKNVPTHPNFNPRTHVGCDPPSVDTTNNKFLFQSTHPCGVRLLVRDTVNLVLLISIHAPMWGATKVVSATLASILFQSTHPCGVRPTLYWGYL